MRGVQRSAAKQDRIYPAPAAYNDFSRPVAGRLRVFAARCPPLACRARYGDYNRSNRSPFRRKRP